MDENGIGRWVGGQQKGSTNTAVPSQTKNELDVPPKTLLDFSRLPSPTPRHYHITGHREKGSLFIYTACYCQNIAFNCCPGFPASMRGGGQRGLIKVMEHNGVSEHHHYPPPSHQTTTLHRHHHHHPSPRSGVGQCERSAT